MRQKRAAAAFWRSTFAGTCLAVLLVAPAEVGSQTLRVVGPAVIRLDPVCNARTGVSTEVLVRNDGTTPTRLALDVGEPVSRPAGKTGTLAVVATPQAGSVAPGESATLKVQVTGALDEGEWALDLRNGGTSFGTLTIVSPAAPFAVKMDVANPDAPELTFEQGRPARIAVKNEDAVAYRLRGEYSLRGTAKSTSEVVLPPKGGAELELVPPDAWFEPSVFTSIRALFKDDVAEGRLFVQAQSPRCQGDDARPARIFKTKTTLSVWPLGVRDLGSNLLIFLVLVAGGVCSLLLNLALPFQSRRLRTKTEAEEIARLIEGLPMQSDSRVRTSVGVEHRRFADRLRALKWYDAQFSAEITEIDEGFKRLRTRLKLIGDMELVLNNFWRGRNGTLPLSVSNDIDESRRQLLDILKRAELTNSDIAAADALIKQMATRLKDAEAKNPEIAGRIVAAIKRLQDFDKQADRGMWSDIKKALGDRFEEILGETAPKEADAVLPGDYFRLERAIFILEQARELVRLHPMAQLSAASGKTEERVRQFLGYLRGGTWDDLQRAHRLIRQMRQQKYFEDVEDDLRAGKWDIETSRNIVRQFEPTELRLVFRDRQVNGAAARDEYIYAWDFDHHGLKENGWSVSHYFPDATKREPRRSRWLWWPAQGWSWIAGHVRHETLRGPYHVKLTLYRDGQEAGVAMRDLDVWPPLRVKMRASLWTEMLRLSLALGIVTAGLIAGAREQILKLDVFAALLAIFLLGFGSDRIKNVFTQSGANDSTPPPTTPTKPPDEKAPRDGAQS